MGLFQSRPEEPTEWAGLPSEPLPPRSAAEALSGGMPSLDLFAATAVESIVIPVAPQIEIVEAASIPADGDDGPESAG